MSDWESGPGSNETLQATVVDTGDVITEREGITVNNVAIMLMTVFILLLMVASLLNTTETEDLCNTVRQLLTLKLSSSLL